MEPKKKRPKAKGGPTAAEQLKKLAEDPQQLKFEARGIARGIIDFWKSLDDVRRRIPALSCMEPICDYVDDVECSVEEACGWVVQFQNDKLPLAELSWNLQHVTANEIISALDCHPVLFQNLQDDAPKSIQPIMDDLQQLADAIFEDIQKEELALYKIFIHAA